VPRTVSGMEPRIAHEPKAASTTAAASTSSQSRGDAMGATLLTWSGLAADSTADSRNWRSSPAMASTAASYANPAGNAYERAFHPYAS